MKLLVIGSAPSSNLYIGSQFVSGYHAEMIILDNGDILVVDKNSTNGTFLNGKRLSPEVEVPVKRGDNIVFADTPLDWSRVPQIKVEADLKQIIGIGSHTRNKIHVAGEKVSRFHATIKQTKDGKWFICDHSTNGTTINGTRIAKDTYVRLKKNDQIKCAGIPVNNPVTDGGNGGKIVGIVCGAVAAVAVVVCAVLFLGTNKKLDDQQLYKKYASSTMIVCCQYHYKVSAGSLNMMSTLGGEEFYIDEDGDFTLFDGSYSHSVLGTGFFISESGMVATNLHIANPWLYQDVIQPVEDIFRDALNNMANRGRKYLIPYISQLKVEGVIDRIFVIPTGQYFDQNNIITCSVLATSNNSDVDLAILQLRQGNGTLPFGSTYVDINRIPDDSAYAQGVHSYTLGYPKGISLQDCKNKQLEAIGASGDITITNNDIDFGLSAVVTHGASGSPVFDDRGRLIGVISRGLDGYNYAVRSKNIKSLLDSKSIKY